MLARGILSIVPLALLAVGMIFYWRHGYRLATRAEQEKNRLQGRLAMDFAFWAILAAVVGICLMTWQISKAEARAESARAYFVTGDT